MPKSETTVGGSGSRAPIREKLGQGVLLGRHLVIEELGRGGMGIVFRAYDPTLQREVALKVLRADKISSTARTRMIREARTMAKLSNANVVAVYDVDFEGDQIAIAMEYVPGPTLRGWMEKRDRDWRDVLNLFVQAGRGLGAAHAEGILHRDFKPSNVLVGEGNALRARVTDFGIAVDSAEARSGSGEGELADSSSDLTEAGNVMGTPWYMAPEQHRGGELTAAADQYAYCLALWEALAGSPPFSRKGLLQHKLRGPPAWTGRPIPRMVTRAIRRGLAPDPADRWPSLAALLDALSRSGGRHRLRWPALVGGAAVIAAVGIGVRARSAQAEKPCTGARDQLAGVWDADRLRAVETAVLGTGKPYAPSVLERLLPKLDAYADQWVQMHTEACAATTIHKEQSTEVLDLRMACLQDAKRRLDAASGVLAGADARVVEKAHALAGGLPPLDRCADIERLEAAVEPPSNEEAETVESARELLARAQASFTAGKFNAALESLRPAEEAIRSLEYEPIRNEMNLIYGRVHHALGDYDAAAEAQRSAAHDAMRWSQWDIAQSALSELGFVTSYRLARVAEGLAYARVAEGLVERTGRPGARANSFAQKGSILYSASRYVEAAAAYREALRIREETDGSGHASMARTRANLANCLHTQGRYAQAEAEYRESLKAKRAQLGPDHPSIATTLNNLGGSLYAQNKMDEGDEALREALRIKQNALGPDHPDVATFRSNFAEALSNRGKHEQAEEEHRKALAVRQKALGPNHPDVARAHGNLASTLHRAGKYAEAEAEYRTCLTLWSRAENQTASHLFRIGLAVTLENLERDEEAEAEYRAVITDWDPENLDHPNLASAHHSFGVFLFNRQQIPEAREHFEFAWRIYQRQTTPTLTQAKAAFHLGQALWETGDADQGRALVERAQREYAQTGKEGASGRQALEEWKRGHP